MTNWFIQSRWTTSELKNSDRLFIFYVSNPLWLHHLTIATLFCLVKYLKITFLPTVLQWSPHHRWKKPKDLTERPVGPGAPASRCPGDLVLGSSSPHPLVRSPSTPGLCFSVCSPCWVFPTHLKAAPTLFLKTYKRRLSLPPYVK